MLPLEKQNALREQYRAENPAWQPATEIYADLVRAHLPPHGRVLDLGCGRGGLVEQLQYPLSQIVGLDPDWLSLREHRLGIPRTAGISTRLPFVDGSFDLVFCSWLLEHLDRPRIDLAQIGRVLRPGGVFVFITPNGRHPLNWLNRALGRFDAVQNRLVAAVYGRAPDDAFPTRYRANSPAVLHRLAAEAGLHLETLHTIPDPTYLAFTPWLYRLMCRFETWLSPANRLHLVGGMRKPTG